MCVITDRRDIVVEITFIPGTVPIGDDYIFYFPVVGNLPNIGDRGYGQKLPNGDWIFNVMEEAQ